jgi:hypothetical protein
MHGTRKKFALATDVCKTLKEVDQRGEGRVKTDGCRRVLLGAAGLANRFWEEFGRQERRPRLGCLRRLVVSKLRVTFWLI